MIDWDKRAERIRRNMRFWGGGGWECRRAATRTVDSKMTREMFLQPDALRQATLQGWDISDYMHLVREEATQ